MGTRNYRELHDKVVARPGAVERLAGLRAETLSEIDLHNLRRSLELSQTEMAERLGMTQAAVSRFERSEDVKVSTLRTYLEGLGATLQLRAVFDDDDTQTEIPFGLGPATAESA